MERSDPQQQGVIGGEFHHLDIRATGFGAAMQEMVAAAAGAPAATAQLEETERISDRFRHWRHRGTGSPAMIAGPCPHWGLVPGL
jgi:hypothetical protein